jgi:hypothetical protein
MIVTSQLPVYMRRKIKRDPTPADANCDRSRKLFGCFYISVEPIRMISVILILPLSNILYNVSVV